MRRVHSLLFSVVLGFILMFPTVGRAQAWSGIIDPSRAIDWSSAGVVGGIPSRTTICSTLSPGATASQINSAISSCPTGQTVFLNAGTYSGLGGIRMKNNVTLRGAGADQTFLVFTGNDGCNGAGTAICFTGSDFSYYGPGPPTNQVNWTAGYAKGTTVITLDAIPGLAVGQYIYIDQLDDPDTPVPSDGVFNCFTTVCTVQGGGSVNARNGRHERQEVKVTAISGTGPFSVTITPGVYMPNYRSSQSPGAWWGNTGALGHDAGVENLSIDGTSSGAGSSNVTMLWVYNVWVKGVRSIIAPSPRAHVIFYQTVHCTVRDSYFYGSVNDASQSTNYGVEDFGASDSLVENNIFQRRGAPLIEDGSMGAVEAYNFSLFDHFDPSSFMQASDYSHQGTNGMILREGNVGPGAKGDIIHATANLMTFYRNAYTGWEWDPIIGSGKTTETMPARLYAYQRYFAFVGNVLGTPGYHTQYVGGNTGIYSLGDGSGAVPSDPVTASTSLRWGNYDTVTANVRWCGNSSDTGWSTTCASTSEIPTTDGVLPNAVPTKGDTGIGQPAMPPSFYLTTKPSWWGTMPWPPIGPDVTTGTVGVCSGGNFPQNQRATKASQCTGTGGTFSAAYGNHVYPNPAMKCYFEVMGGPADGSGSVLKFNANNCYGSGSAALPAPPSGLRAVVL